MAAPNPKRPKAFERMPDKGTTDDLKANETPIFAHWLTPPVIEST
jgi:hypothetical protein